MGSTPRNLLKGNTASFTEKYSGTISLLNFCASRLIPAIHKAPTFAKDLPIHFETKGIVLEALGFTSSKYSSFL